MSDIAASDGEFKAILESELSDGAKLAAIAELLGARGTEEIAKAVNKPIRTVERHYAELRKIRKIADTQICGTQNCGNTQICVEKPAELRTETPQICVAPSCAPASVTPRATNELPSEVDSIEEVLPPLRTPSPSKTKSVRGTRLANDWELPDDWRQWVLVNCPCSSPETVSREALIFANYWQALAGQKATKVDWRKTWQNWALKAFATAPLRYAPAAQTPSWQEDRRRKTRELMALANGEAHGHG